MEGAIEIEDEDENRSHISSAVSFGEKQADLSSREVLNNETSFDVNTSLVSTSSSSDVLPNPSLSLETNGGVRLQIVQDLNSTAPNLSNHIDNTIEKNSAFLGGLRGLNPSEPGESYLLFGKFDSCTPLIHCIISIIKSNGDLKSFLSYMSIYALVVAPNMEIFASLRRQMKQRASLLEAKANEIVTFNTKDPLSFAAKAFAEKEDANETSDGDRTVSLSPRDAAAVDAYNVFAGTDYDQLPSACAILNQKVKNVSLAALSIVMAVRVAKLIKISDVHSRMKKVDIVREQKLELLFVLARIIKPDLSEKDIRGMTLHQYFVDILYPTTDLSTEKLFEPVSISTGERQILVSIIIQSSSFLKDEMNDKKFIDIFKKSESCSLVDDMDELRPVEIQQRCDEMTDEDFHFCGKGKNGKILTNRRQPCAAILFSLPNAKILGKILKCVGFEENTIEVFLFGLLSSATFKFVRSGKPLAFLFDETNYRRYEMDSNIENVEDLVIDIENVTDLITNNIKPVIDTAVLAIRDFKKETHFAEKSDIADFTKYLGLFGITE